MSSPNQPFEDPPSMIFVLRWALALFSCVIPVLPSFPLLVLVHEALFRLCPVDQVDQYRCTALWFQPVSTAATALLVALIAMSFVALPTYFAPSTKPLIAKTFSILGVVIGIALTFSGSGFLAIALPWCVGVAAAAYFSLRKRSERPD